METMCGLPTDPFDFCFKLCLSDSHDPPPVLPLLLPPYGLLETTLQVATEAMTLPLGMLSQTRMPCRHWTIVVPWDTMPLKFQSSLLQPQ
jgi:hypothetical protein